MDEPSNANSVPEGGVANNMPEARKSQPMELEVDRTAFVQDVDAHPPHGGDRLLKLQVEARQRLREMDPPVSVGTPQDGGVPSPLAKIFEKNLEEPFYKHKFKRTQPSPRVFGQICEVIATTGLISHAALSAGVDRTTIAQWRKTFPEFDQALTFALELYKEVLQEEAHLRATVGVREPVFYKGSQCGFIVRKSDRLLELLLKRYDPAFRESATNVQQTNIGGVLVVNPPAQSEEDWISQGDPSHAHRQPLPPPLPLPPPDQDSAGPGSPPPEEAAPAGEGGPDAPTE